ncbi:MAG TPA: winged helix-turn-helix domain-containing protein [Solirubrobacterales bacterium]
MADDKDVLHEIDLGRLDTSLAARVGNVIRAELRIAILVHLLRNPRMSPRQVARALHVTEGNTGYHFGKLVEAGAIDKVDSDKVRGATRGIYMVTDFGQHALRVAVAVKSLA